MRDKGHIGLSREISSRMFNHGSLNFIANADFYKSPHLENQTSYVTHDSRSHEYHEDVLYRVNKSGFFGEDFIENAEILTMGCSVTAGIGVGTSFAWPQIIKDHTSLTLNNASFPGASIQQIALLLFEFIEKYNAPKHLLILLPEISRQWVFTDKPPYRERLSWDKRSGSFWSHDEGKNPEQYSDKNKFALNICIQNSIISIIQISKFCNLMGINLGFYSWEKEDNEVYDSLSIDGYLDYKNLRKDLFSNNCFNHKKQQKSKAFWDIGIDKRHPGYHDQIHFSEVFLHFLENKNK